MAFPTLIFVHGGWSGEWVWEKLAPHLIERQIPHHTLDLPGSGANKKMPWRVSMNDYIHAINALAENVDGPVALVGHSAGGFPVSQAASVAPEKYSALVYLAAHLPVSGERLAAFAMNDKGSEMSKAVKFDLISGVLRLAPEISRDILYHDYPGSDLDDLMTKHGPEPLRPGISKVSLSEQFADTPKHYIQCQNDRAISLDYQQFMCDRYNLTPAAVLATGHMPMFVDPALLADALVRVLGEVT